MGTRHSDVGGLPFFKGTFIGKGGGRKIEANIAAKKKGIARQGEGG